MRASLALAISIVVLLFQTADGEARNVPPPLEAVEISDGRLDIDHVAAAAGPSVVHIISSSSVSAGQFRIVVGQGSGIVFDESGHIVTNNHVIVDGDLFEVLVPDGRRLDANLIGRDTRTDLAVLQVDPGGLTIAQLGDSDQIQIGQEVLALGYAASLPNPPNPRLGIILALDARISDGNIDYEKLIRSDVPLYPGDSGGPLLDDGARVIGLNTAILARRAGGVDISYSIPMNRVRSIAVELIANGRITRPWLGVSGYSSTPTIAQSFNVRYFPGVLVLSVQPGSPAQLAGLQPGDIIVEFNGTAVSTVEELSALFAEREPGETVELIVAQREGFRRIISITLAEAPA